ncbi:MAG TPA: hypothetical protein VMC44_04490 [Geobacteraceae bacterium]|nr:hypothetical protein [Geobacteraceae bacterium]
MAIMVHFRDDTVSFVPDKDLGELILTNSIVAFRRGTRWVSIAAAPGHNAGKERRGAATKGEVWKRIRVSGL